METITFTLTDDFAARVRTAILHEQPELAKQDEADITEAARVKVRTMICDWIHAYERGAAARAAQNAVIAPTDADIT